MSQIIISPFSRPLRNGGKNPKDYPYWPAVVSMLQSGGFEVIHVKPQGDTSTIGANYAHEGMSIAALKGLIVAADTWASVDNFFPHLAVVCGRPGVAVFSQSNPDIFGYPQNTNLLKDKRYLRRNQFWLWEQTDYEPNAYVAPEEVVKAVVVLSENKNRNRGYTT